MEQTCYRCGQPVEEGVAFCENCKAPQIRVVVPSENEPATPSMRPGTPGEMQPPARPVDLGSAAVHCRGYSVPQRRFRWRDAVPGAVLAGGIIGLSWMIPPIGFLLWPMTAGVLGVIFYQRRVSDAVITKGIGARIGALTGFVGFTTFAVLAGISALAQGRQKMQEQLNAAFQQALASNPDPQMQAAMQHWMTPTKFALLFALAGVVFLVMVMAFSSLGGYIGSKLVSPRSRK